VTDWKANLRRVTINGRNLIGASFRGVPFFVDADERGGGRRGIVHEFPLSDDAFVEDLGRKSRSFHFEGYVVGDDYIAQRDALLTAAEDVEGPGELVHPQYGVKQVICLDVKVRHTRTEGRIATIALEFAETPAKAPVPSEVVDDAAQTSTSADAAIVATKAELVDSFSAAGLPSFALASAERALTKATATLGEKLAPVVAASQELAEMTGRIALITAEAASLVRQPASVLDQFRAAVLGLVETIAAAPGEVMEALVEAYGIEFGEVIPTTTATRQRELANQTALIAGLRRVMAIEAARLAPLVTYTSIEDAIEARDAIVEILDDQCEGADDIAYPALAALRADVMRSVPGGAAFASIVPVTRNVPTPSILLAYQLYGDVDLEADIVARNRIRHPGFVAGSLKVLSDA
jgi:prophage DNA circulation protein